MPTCSEIAALATDYVEGHLGAAERERYQAHLAGCDACATFARQLQVTSRAVAAMPEPQVPLALRGELLARFDEWSSRREGAGVQAAAARPRWVARASALAALAAFGVLLALSRRPSRSAADWVVALLLAGVAAVLAGRGGRVTWGLAAVAAAASAGAALVGGPGALEPGTGLDCLLLELATAAGTAGTLWLAFRGGPAALTGSSSGALAVAGALAGAASLQITCGAHSSTVHALAFHAGGVVLAAAAAALLPRLLARAV